MKNRYNILLYNNNNNNNKYYIAESKTPIIQSAGSKLNSTASIYSPYNPSHLNQTKRTKPLRPHKTRGPSPPFPLQCLLSLFLHKEVLVPLLSCAMPMAKLVCVLLLALLGISMISTQVSPLLKYSITPLCYM